MSTKELFHLCRINRAQPVLRGYRRIFSILLVTTGMTIQTSTAHGQGAANDTPEYAEGNALVFPADYRSWPFIGAGLGMSYLEEGGTPEQQGSPPFSQVFVNPAAYRQFMETGRWRDGTVFMLEFRRSESQGSINLSGHYATDLVQLEAEVKDSRFADGWAYYMFGAGEKPVDAAEPLEGAAAAPCVACHTEHGAVERTFVQFYPTLLDVAREKGTLNPGFTDSDIQSRETNEAEYKL